MVNDNELIQTACQNLVNAVQSNDTNWQQTATLVYNNLAYTDNHHLLAKELAKQLIMKGDDIALHSEQSSAGARYHDFLNQQLQHYYQVSSKTKWNQILENIYELMITMIATGKQECVEKALIIWTNALPLSQQQETAISYMNAALIALSKTLNESEDWQLFDLALKKAKEAESYSCDLIINKKNDGSILYHIMKEKIENITCSKVIHSLSLILKCPEADLSLLHVAAEMGSVKLGKWLTDNFTHVDLTKQTQPEKMTFIHQAIYHGKVSFFKWAAQKFPDLLNQPSANGCYATHWAASRGQIQILKHLKDTYKKSFSEHSTDGATPIHWAASLAHLDTVEFLLNNGVHLDEKDTKLGGTCLDWAIFSGDVLLIEKLIKIKPNLSIDDNQRMLLFCARGGHQDLFQHLLAKRLPIDCDEELIENICQHALDCDQKDFLLWFYRKYLTSWGDRLSLCLGSSIHKDNENFIRYFFEQCLSNHYETKEALFYVLMLHSSNANLVTAIAIDKKLLNYSTAEIIYYSCFFNSQLATEIITQQIDHWIYRDPDILSKNITIKSPAEQLEQWEIETCIFDLLYKSNQSHAFRHILENKANHRMIETHCSRTGMLEYCVCFADPKCVEICKSSLENADDKAQFWHQEAPALLTLCNEHHSDDLTNWCLKQITNNSDAKFWHEHSINILLGIQSIRDWCKAEMKAKLDTTFWQNTGKDLLMSCLEQKQYQLTSWVFERMLEECQEIFWQQYGNMIAIELLQHGLYQLKNKCFKKMGIKMPSPKASLPDPKASSPDPNPPNPKRQRMW